jgi:hypothetical protein
MFIPGANTRAGHSKARNLIGGVVADALVTATFDADDSAKGQ